MMQTGFNRSKLVFCGRIRIKRPVVSVWVYLQFDSDLQKPSARRCLGFVWLNVKFLIAMEIKKTKAESGK